MHAWTRNGSIYQSKIPYMTEYIIFLEESKFSENLDEIYPQPGIRDPSIGPDPGNSENQPAKLGIKLIISELPQSILK